jgi:hypothetical protein
MSAGSSIIFVGNDSVIRLEGLSNTAGEFQNNATVTVEEVVDLSTSTPVGGAVYPITLAYIPTSDGVYEGLLPYTLDIESGRTYQAKVRVVAASGLRGEWEERLRARVRMG